MEKRLNECDGQKKNRETVLVTGATGFLGKYLVQRLTGEYRVLALGRNREQGQQLEAYGAVFCPGDFTDRKSCASYFEDVHYVIHAGALSTVWGKWEDFYKTNVLGTNLVAELCMENKVRRLVYISSPSIYTKREDQLGIREEQAPRRNDLNYYIKSKLLAEKKIREWSRKGLESVILRPRGLIGIGDTSLVPRLLRANAKIGIPLFNGGHNLIDVTSVENAALACRLAMTAEGAAGKVFNITNGEPTEFRKLLEQFLEAIGEPPRYRELPFKLMYEMAEVLEWLYRTFQLSGEPPLTRYTVCTLGYAQTMDISRAREILGYCPEKTLQETIQEYGAWWKKTYKNPKAATLKNQQSSTYTSNISNIPYKDTFGKRPGRINQVKLYQCGSCKNNLGIIYGGRAWEWRNFPARVALIQHRELGNILYDAGYSEEIFGDDIWLKLYRLLNPVLLDREDVISEKLKKDGIPLESVKTIILSHAHPDHVGGLSQFSNYELIASGEVLAALKKPSIRNLMFPNMIPPKGCIQKERPTGNQLHSHFLCKYFENVYDLLGDESVIGVLLDGHCKGQLGLWIPDFELFLAADACWGGDLIRDSLHMRLIPRWIQNDYAAYKDSLRRICLMKREHPQIQVVFTHQRGGEQTYA